jgi:phosphate transport system protein
MARLLDPLLREVNELILRMGGACEAILAKSMRAVLERNVELARQVAKDDLEIDRLDVELDESVLRALALQAPVADDLRRVLAVKSIAVDLERVGDIARNIAKSAERLAVREPVPLPPMLEALAGEAQTMLRESLDCFVARDAARAQSLLARDDTVDLDEDRLIEEALREIAARPATSAQEVDLILIAKNLERVADHATNIAEDVILVVEGRNVKHAGKLSRSA